MCANSKRNIPILPEAFLTFASKSSVGPSYVANGQKKRRKRKKRTWWNHKRPPSRRGLIQSQTIGGQLQSRCAHQKWPQGVESVHFRSYWRFIGSITLHHLKWTDSSPCESDRCQSLRCETNEHLPNWRQLSIIWRAPAGVKTRRHLSLNFRENCNENLD